MTIETNLFGYASQELSHSAYWAWILSSLGDQTRKDMEGPRRIALRFLHNLFDSPPKLPIKELRREQPLPKKSGRADIYLEDSRDRVFVIETKASRTASEEQLKRYKAALGENGSVALVSTYFDADAFESELFHSLDLEGLIGVVGDDGDSHPFVQEHTKWLLSKQRQKALLSEIIYGPDIQEAVKILGNSEDSETAQWIFMHDLVTKIEIGQGKRTGMESRSADTSKGRPWVQYQFYEVGTRNPYTIFWRLDSSTRGPFLAMREYRKHVTKDIRKRNRRLELLRELWIQSVDNTHTPLKIENRLRNRGQKEREIGLIYLDRNNSPSQLLNSIPHIHLEFTRILKKHESEFRSRI